MAMVQITWEQVVEHMRQGAYTMIGDGACRWCAIRTAHGNTILVDTDNEANIATYYLINPKEDRP